jgi:hypothetical protein
MPSPSIQDKGLAVLTQSKKQLKQANDPKTGGSCATHWKYNCRLIKLIQIVSADPHFIHLWRKFWLFPRLLVAVLPLTSYLTVGWISKYKWSKCSPTKASPSFQDKGSGLLCIKSCGTVRVLRIVAPIWFGGRHQFGLFQCFRIYPFWFMKPSFLVGTVIICQLLSAMGSNCMSALHLIYIYTTFVGSARIPAACLPSTRAHP